MTSLYVSKSGSQLLCDWLHEFKGTKLVKKGIILMSNYSVFWGCNSFVYTYYNTNMFLNFTQNDIFDPFDTKT